MSALTSSDWQTVREHYDKGSNGLNVDFEVVMDAPENSSSEQHQIRKLSISLVLGLVIAIFGLMPYYRPDLVVERRFDPLFKVAAALFMPGLLAAALLGGNVHDASLTLGAIANSLLYGLGLFVILKGKKK